MNITLIIIVLVIIAAIVIITKIIKKLVKIAILAFIVLIFFGAFTLYSIDKDLESINVTDVIIVIEEDGKKINAVKDGELLNQTIFDERVFVIDAEKLDDAESYEKQIQEKLDKEYLLENTKSEPETKAFKYKKTSKLWLKIKK